MNRWQLLLTIPAALLVVFAATTWWALEASGVAIIQTVAPDGSLRETHVWFVEADGELWLEAGTPTNPWYLDIQQNPSLKLRADDLVRNAIARLSSATGAHERIRSLLRQKYGLRDWWVGLLVDSSRSVAVELIEAAAQSEN
jgi:hypothetical protein